MLVDHESAAVRLLAVRRPDLPDAVDAHYAAAAAVLGPRLTELTRERVAALVAGAEPAIDGRLPEVARAVLAFADQFFHSPHWVTDEHVDALLAELEPGQAFAVAVVASLSERWMRMTRMLAAFAED